MAEGERLADICRIQSLPELFQIVFPESELAGILDFQRFLVYDLLGELSDLNAYLSGPGADLIGWIPVRFQVENLKVLIRGCLTGVKIEEDSSHLILLPGELALETEALATAESPEDFVPLVPKGLLRENMERALEIYRDRPQPFFFEAALDRGYFQGLVARVEGLKREDRQIVAPMVYQEVDTFHMMLVARGRFNYGLAPENLLPLHIAGARVPLALFAAMLSDQDVFTLAGRVLQRALDTVPSGQEQGAGPVAVYASTLEKLAWKRFLRLSNTAFRQSHMGLGAIVGYTGLRRIETANLITISEGINSGMSAEKIRRRLITQADAEGVYV